jgi:hypothetical protein
MRGYLRWFVYVCDRVLRMAAVGIFLHSRASYSPGVARWFVQQQMADSQSLVLFTNAKVFGREPVAHMMSLMCLSSSVMVIPPIASISN